MVLIANLVATLLVQRLHVLAGSLHDLQLMLLRQHLMHELAQQRLEADGAMRKDLATSERSREDVAVLVHIAIVQFLVHATQDLREGHVPGAQRIELVLALRATVGTMMAQPLEVLLHFLDTAIQAVDFSGESHQCCIRIRWMIARGRPLAQEQVVRILIVAIAIADVVGR